MKLPEKADIERIARMEQAFERVIHALDSGAPDEDYLEEVCLLEEYVSSGQWLRDYESDEQGQWPRNMKRGVLSQDALYDLLRRTDKKEGEKA